MAMSFGGGGSGNNFDVLLNFIANTEEAKQNIQELIALMNQVNNAGNGAGPGTGGGTQSGGTFTSGPNAGGTYSGIKDFVATATDYKQGANIVAQSNNAMAQSEIDAGDAMQHQNRIMLGLEEETPKVTQNIQQLTGANQQNTQALGNQNKVGQDAVNQAIQMQWEYRRLQYAGRALTEIAQTFYTPSVNALKQMTALAENYVKTTQDITSTTVGWKAAQDSLNASKNEFGAIIAQIELPALQEVSRLAAVGSEFIQENPQLVKDTIVLLGGVAAISGIALLAAKGIRLYADIEYIGATNALFAAENAQSAAATANTDSVIILTEAVNANTVSHGGEAVRGAVAAGAGAVAVTGGTAGMASTLGALALAPTAFLSSFKDEITDASQAQKQQEQQQDKLIMKTGDWGQKIMAVIDFLQPGTNKFLGDVKAWYDKIIGAATGSGSPTVPVDQQSWYAQGLSAWETYQNQLTTLQTNYNEKKVEIENNTVDQLNTLWTNYNKQVTTQEESFNLSQQRSLQDFNTSQADSAAKFYQSQKTSETSYYRTRMDEALKYNVDVQRAEEDHQKEMFRLAQDHNITMQDLTESRDALGMVREMRSYELKRSRDEEDYITASKRRSQDYAMQIAQQEQSFADQRKQALDAFEQQQADRQAQFDVQRARQQQDNADQLADNYKNALDQQAIIVASGKKQINDLSASLVEDQNTAQQAFATRLSALDGFVATTTNTYLNGLIAKDQAFTAYMQGSFAALFGGATGNTSYKHQGRAAGGYAESGLYWLAEQGKEFVLNNDITRLAERVVGGGLTQDKIAGMMLRGGGRNMGSSYQDARQFNMSGMTAQDRMLVKDWINTANNRLMKEFQ